MGDRVTLEPLLARIKKRPNYRHNPVKEKSLETLLIKDAFAMFRRASQKGEVLFWKRYLILNHPLLWILECIQLNITVTRAYISQLNSCTSCLGKSSVTVEFVFFALQIL